MGSVVYDMVRNSPARENCFVVPVPPARIARNVYTADCYKIMRDNTMKDKMVHSCCGVTLAAVSRAPC